MARKARPWFSTEKGWWMVHLRGQKVRLVKGKDNKPEAERKFHELLYLQESNQAPESDQHTVASIIELYLEHARHRYAERTLYERKLILQSFAEVHGFRKVNDKECLPYHLTSWLDSRTEWKSDWTKATAVSCVQRPFNWAAQQRLISANPFRGVTHRPGSPRRPLTDEEFNSLLQAAEGRKTKKSPTPGERFQELLWFLRLTGARPGEAAQLEWQHVDCKQALIVLPKHKTVRMQRTPKPRVFPLHERTVNLLIRIRQRGEKGELVFRTHRGTPWNRSNLSLRMRRAREKAGLPSHAKLYGIRHAFGTRAIVNGVDLKTLSELLGHTSTRMSEHYVHLAGQRSHLHRAVERINLPPEENIDS